MYGKGTQTVVVIFLRALDKTSSIHKYLIRKKEKKAPTQKIGRDEEKGYQRQSTYNKTRNSIKGNESQKHLSLTNALIVSRFSVARYDERENKIFY